MQSWIGFQFYPQYSSQNLIPVILVLYKDVEFSLDYLNLLLNLNQNICFKVLFIRISLLISATLHPASRLHIFGLGILRFQVLLRNYRYTETILWRNYSVVNDGDPISDNNSGINAQNFTSITDLGLVQAAEVYIKWQYAFTKRLEIKVLYCSYVKKKYPGKNKQSECQKQVSEIFYWKLQ